MKRLTREEQIAYIKMMKETYALLEQMRNEALRDLPYNAQDVQTLLDLGHLANLPSRTSTDATALQDLRLKWLARQAERKAAAAARRRARRGEAAG